MHHRSRPSSSSLAIVAVGLLVAFLLPGAAAQRSSSGPVAVVNLNGVMVGLTERLDAEAKLRAKGEAIRAETETRQASLRALEEEFRAVTDPVARLAAEERLDGEVVQFMAWDALAKQELDSERAWMLQGLYIDIMAAVKQMADADHIDLVLVHDGSQDIQVNPDPEAPPAEYQVRQQIAMRRIAFAAPRIDRTQDVIIRMNNAYNPTTP
ncbi:MAG: OmpH family outer membrane protein [Phycisphaerales bacterium]|jgi:Skp family chaperone for outer membrane proteins|nr:OmpH family outer membrane protein [Phycisphaerales bacterium]